MFLQESFDPLFTLYRTIYHQKPHKLQQILAFLKGECIVSIFIVVCSAFVYTRYLFDIYSSGDIRQPSHSVQRALQEVRGLSKRKRGKMAQGTKGAQNVRYSCYVQPCTCNVSSKVLLTRLYCIQCLTVIHNKFLVIYDSIFILLLAGDNHH